MSLANCNFFIFSNNGVLGGFLPIAWLHMASSKLLQYSQVTLTFFDHLGADHWLSLCHLAILRSIRMVVFRFLPHLSGFGSHFKAFDIVLADQPFIFCTFICFPLSNQLFKQSTLLFWTMSGKTHFQIFREKCTVQHLLPSSLNKGHLFDTSYFHRMIYLSKLHTAIILNTPFSINDSISQNQ